MLHPDAEELVDIATADNGDPAAASHLQSCGECEAAVAEYRQVMSLLAGADRPDTQLTEPPAGLWPRIAAAIAADEAGPAEPPDAQSSQHGHPIELHKAPAPPHPGASPHDTQLSQDAKPSQGPRPSQDPKPPRQLRGTSGRFGGLARGWLAAAAVAGLAVGLLGGYALWDNGQTPQSGTPTAIASAELDTLDSLRQRGNATVTRSGQSVNLAVTTEQFDPEGGYLEVWLINRDLTRMISVGVLPADAREASYPISEDLLAQGYTVVDISREDFDDNPLHSGDSIVRGELPI